MPTATNLTHADSPYVPADGASLWLRCDTSGGDITIHGAASPTTHGVLIISNDINAGNVVTWTGSGDPITLQNGESLVVRYDDQATRYTPLALFSVSPTYNSATIFALWAQAIYGPAGPGGSGVEVGVVDSPGPGLLHIGPGDRDNPAIVFDQFMGPAAGLPVIRGGLRYIGLQLVFTDVTGVTRPLLLGRPIAAAWARGKGDGIMASEGSVSIIPKTTPTMHSCLTISDHLLTAAHKPRGVSIPWQQNTPVTIYLDGEQVEHADVDIRQERGGQIDEQVNVRLSARSNPLVANTLYAARREHGRVTLRIVSADTYAHKPFDFTLSLMLGNIQIAHMDRTFGALDVDAWLAHNPNGVTWRMIVLDEQGAHAYDKADDALFDDYTAKALARHIHQQVFFVPPGIRPPLFEMPREVYCPECDYWLFTNTFTVLCNIPHEKTREGKLYHPSHSGGTFEMCWVCAHKYAPDEVSAEKAAAEEAKRVRKVGERDE